jgi:hypothetical protein
MTRLMLVVALMLGLTSGVAGAAQTTELRVSGGVFRDDQGREVVLRGFNVSGEAKLAENQGLPFANVADARLSASAMRRLTGANAVRFLVTWAWIEPRQGQIDHAYLAKVAEQITAFTDQGIRVYLDFHQDLYSRYLFNKDSWYTGDGAPAWLVQAGNYPKESCGLCFHWGQNMKSNKAVTDAVYDFWHNRQIGSVRVQDAFLAQAGETMRYLRTTLSPDAFRMLLGVDPLNEPYAGRYDTGQNSLAWERDLLWPFYQRFRQAMDDSGWTAKAAFVEPLLFWNNNVSFFAEPGGLTQVPALGDRYVFNAHFYDGAAQSGILKPGKAVDGEYAKDFAKIRDRASALGSPAIVSEFGHPVGGNTSDKLPEILKAMYQSLDSRLSGADWWTHAAASGPVLSGSQWHWDIYDGRHHELMNDDPNKVKTAGDAMNDEQFSAVRLDDAGNAVLTVDSRTVDRVYPRAVAGTTVAFTYEDTATGTWNKIPAGMPAVRALVGAKQFGVLAWRSNSTDVPTEIHLPASFSPASVVVDADTSVGTPTDGTLDLRATTSTLHFALITTGATTPEARAAAQAELVAWTRTLEP